MRILFVLKGLALVRHFDEVLTRLADKHQIVLAPTKFGDDHALPDALTKHPNCSVLQQSPKRADGAREVATLRSARDFLRYHEPTLAGASANRRRALSNLVRVVSQGTRTLPDDLPDLLVPLTLQEQRGLRKTFSHLETLIPPDPRFAQFLTEQKPDVLLITPLVSFGGLHSDFVKAARWLGIPSACLVFSWDNLTNKGMIHERPDRTFVWNEIQRKEATGLHGLDPSTVVATGAPRFDPFFRQTAATTREAFCSGLGLDPGRRLIAYLASSPIVSAREPAFVTRWVEAIRASTNPVLRDAQIVIRPHPRVKTIWQDYPAFAKKGPADARYPGVAVTNPKSANGDAGLFDTLFHADAVVGLNTTAELEAGILGKPVYTIRVSEFATGQTGSHHFHYLLREHGGFVECANTLEQHLAHLAAGLSGSVDQDHVRTFIERFVRPHGLDTPVAPLLAEAIAEWARQAVADRPHTPPAATHRTPQLPVESERAAGTSRPAKAQVVYDKAPLFILAETRAEREWRLDPGRKEPWTVAWLDNNVRPGDVVYDIGANVGVFSLIAAANLGGDGTVIAFEPGFATFARLCENIRLNNFTRVIVPVPVPLSHQPGLQRFRYKSMEPGQSRHRFSAQAWNPTDKIKSTEQPMLAMSLDQAIRDFGIPRPTLIKLDVDGAETLVLQGGSETVRHPALRSVIAEIDPDCEAAVLDILGQSGFTLVGHHKRKKKSGPWYGVFRRS
jgi:FkbM family methyltransferase